jgi:type IV secretion system protein VirD4
MKARVLSNAVGLPEAEQTFKGQSRFVGHVFGYACLLAIGANIALTQRLAHAFGYDERLGDPLTGHLYAPWAWLQWTGFIAANRPTFLWAFGLVGGATFLFAYAGFHIIAYRSRRSRAVTKLHGSAHWATPKEIHKSGLIPRDGSKGAGVYVGAWQDPKKNIRYLRHNGPEHILAFAPTRSGKGIGLIIPTLLSWEQSVVVYDLKGENWALTAGWRRKAGHKVVKFDPMDTEKMSARWNPLAEVRLGTLHEVADVQNIVHMVIDPDGKGVVEHWDKTSLMFLVGVVLYVLYTAKAHGRVGTLPDVAGAMTSGDGIDRLYTNMKENKINGGEPHAVIAGSAIDMMEKEDRERGSVLSTAKTFFLLYADPVVAANVSESDFKIRDLMQHKDPVSLYIVVDPANKERLKPLVRLLITQIVRGLTPRLAFKEGRAVRGYKHRLLLLLDEFPALGKLPIFQDALAHIAGYGIKAYLIAQDLSQLTNAYGPNESIKANCHIKIAYAPNNLETAEMLSKMTGTATVVKRVVGTSGKRSSLILSQVNESLQEFARPLLTPDECARLPGAETNREGLVTKAGDMLVFVTGKSPIYGRQILYFNDPVFSTRAKIAAPAVTDRLTDNK